MLYKEKCLKLEHEILYTEAISAPDIDGKDELYFYDTKIKKTCIHDNQAITIWQSFEVEASSGLIDKINGYNTMPSSWLRNNVGNVANQTAHGTNTCDNCTGFQFIGGLLFQGRP